MAALAEGGFVRLRPHVASAVLAELRRTEDLAEFDRLRAIEQRAKDALRGHGALEDDDDDQEVAERAWLLAARTILTGEAGGA